jgi:hypothetical protein
MFQEPASAQTDALRGRVTDAAGVPIGGANVFLLETLDGVITAEDGGFALRVAERDVYTLVVQHPSYRQKRVSLAVPSADSVEVTLVGRVVALPSIQVDASRRGAAGPPPVTLTPLDVVTTPGTAADVFRALRTYPGVTPVDEGAGLFVRGGDVGETRVLIDGAVAVAPYRYESPSGGFFGTFDPFLLEGITFATGGFGAQHGDALSAVASLRTQARPVRASRGLTASLANVSASLAQPLGDAVGVRVTATRSHTGLLFRLNGTGEEFERVPGSTDLSSSLAWQYGGGGEVKVFGLTQRSRLGIRIDDPSYDGALDEIEDHDLIVATWQDEVAGVRLRAVAGTDLSQRSLTLGALDLATRDRLRQVRLSATAAPISFLDVSAGADIEWRRSAFDGTVPKSHHDVGPDAPVTPLRSAVDGRRAGAFIESDWRPADAFRATVGVRTDRSTLTLRRTWDPRVAVAWRPSPVASLTGAWGIYHQVAGPQLYEPGRGDPELPPMRARHLVVGMQLQRGSGFVRAELYDKRYRDLAQLTRDGEARGGGKGESRGLDLFAQSPSLLGFDTRFAYSLHRSRRTDPDAGVIARSPFDITHATTLVVSYALAAYDFGITYQAATGRPLTPIVAAEPDPERPIWHPVYGPPQSERLPPFRRFDLSGSRLVPISDDAFLVAFIGITNVLDRVNVTGYHYSTDYTERTEQRSPFSRSVYVGATLTF